MKDTKFNDIAAVVAKHDKLTGIEFVNACNADGVSTKDLDAYAKEGQKRERIGNAAKRVKR